MMIVHDTYVVRFKLKSNDEARTLRVSQPDLEAFIKVLLFNNAELFEAQKESNHSHHFQQTGTSG
jgi:hypothetical protein